MRMQRSIEFSLTCKLLGEELLNLLSVLDSGLIYISSAITRSKIPTISVPLSFTGTMPSLERVT